MAFSMAMAWHEGEEKMHKLMQVPDQDNPSSSMLTPQAANMLQRGPLIAIGTLDKEMRPWTTLWGGEPPLSQPLAQSIIGVKSFVDRENDPVVNILFGDNPDGEVIREEGEGRMVSGLTIDLEARKRVKIFGKLMAGAVATVNKEESAEEAADAQSQVQMVVRILESLGNCPKYLNSKKIIPEAVSPSLASKGPDLTIEAADLIRKADLFFVSSSHNDLDMDTNHRGGPPGFVRVQKSESGEWELYWPEYSGNRLYQTLGNLQATPKAGLVFPDFETGDVVYVTGNTEVLIMKDAARVLPRSNLAVKVTITDARHVRKGLPFRGVPGQPSPYNPQVRPLASENALVADGDKSGKINTATLLSKTAVTPTISKYRFTMGNNPGSWTAGQWVALDFSNELDIGYSHMRDDDPLSINDDFVRTFTVSSSPAPREKRSDDEFEITIRKVGRITKFLSMQGRSGGLEVPVRGFGGDVRIEQDEGQMTPVVVGGVGATPLLAQLPELDLDRLKVFFTLHVDDTDLVLELLDRRPEVGKCLSLFITGTSEEKLKREEKALNRIRESGASLEMRRLQKEDLEQPNLGDRWHVCVSPNFRKLLMDWLPNKNIVYEDFNF